MPSLQSLSIPQSVFRKCHLTYILSLASPTNLVQIHALPFPHYATQAETSFYLWICFPPTPPQLVLFAHLHSFAYFKCIFWILNIRCARLGAYKIQKRGLQGTLIKLHYNLFCPVLMEKCDICLQNVEEFSRKRHSPKCGVMEGAGQNSWRRRRAGTGKGLGLKTLITPVALPCQRARPKQGALYIQCFHPATACCWGAGTKIHQTSRRLNEGTASLSTGLIRGAPVTNYIATQSHTF